MMFIEKARVYFDRELFGQEWLEAYDLEIEGEMVKFKYDDFLRNNKKSCIITTINKVVIDYDLEN